MEEVRAWQEVVKFPTYESGKPEKNPLFLEKRVYQGTSGVVYPQAVVESVSDTKHEREYNAVFLENRYLKIMILPELGGRIQRAYDKIRKRDFIYYNHVIKPALVGLTGPWISGGIEFNWPQHHRPSTFKPVDFSIERNEDESITVWVNEIEVMFRTKGAAGFTLYPDKAFLEIRGRVFNRTALPQTFLWWANPAVKVNEHYRSIFPPDVYAVFDHGRREVSGFPIAKGIYYKVNYAPGTDISKYDTIPVPTSYMAIASKYDFIGCYEDDTDAGMLHVADHHFSPGKKQWTWGNGDFGHTWDRHLTDEDGPYIELMTGVYTDNQPDFSWLMPNEEKTFEQYFLPFAQTGGIKNATKEAVINIRKKRGLIDISVYTTSAVASAEIKVFQNDQLVKNFKSDISPEKVFEETVENKTDSDLTDWRFVVESDGKVLVDYRAEKIIEKDLPPAAQAVLPPEKIVQTEDLYLTGLHLEQYRHATYSPVDYYEEGLRRDPADSRCNNALGLLLLRRGQFGKAAPYFRTAIKKITERNPNPYDGEPYFNLGVCLFYQGRLDEAYDAFYKSVWNDAWQHAGYLFLAEIKCIRKDYTGALYLIEKSLIRNYHSNTARFIKTAILRKLKRWDEQETVLNASLRIDRFNDACIFEKYLREKIEGEEKSEATLSHLITLMHGSENNYLELSLDYANAGFYEEAASVLQIFITKYKDRKISPLFYYYLGYFTFREDPEKAASFFKAASLLSPDFVFPNKLEEINILQKAVEVNPEDAKAYYYLGNLWYDKKQYEDAISCWEASARINDKFPTVLRNLALARYNKQKLPEEAQGLLEKAFASDPADARVLMELDQLYKLRQKSFTFRLHLLEEHPDLVEKRDDLYVEWVSLQNNLGNFERADELLLKRNFHPWEGGEGKVISQFNLCRTELAKQAIQRKEFNAALDYLKPMEKYPENLGEGKLITAQENDLFFLKGLALEELGERESALQQFRKATEGISEPYQAIYYNDPQPDKIIYQGFAWIRLGNVQKAKEIFERCIHFGNEHYRDKIRIDYFAVSLPDLLVFDIDLDKRNKIHCQYLIGLGLLGLRDFDNARKTLGEVLTGDCNHQGAASFLRLMDMIDGGLPVFG